MASLNNLSQVAALLSAGLKDQFDESYMWKMIENYYNQVEKTKVVYGADQPLVVKASDSNGQKITVPGFWGVGVKYYKDYARDFVVFTWREPDGTRRSYTVGCREFQEFENRGQLADYARVMLRGASRDYIDREMKPASVKYWYNGEESSSEEKSNYDVLLDATPAPTVPPPPPPVQVKSVVQSMAAAPELDFDTPLVLVQESADVEIDFDVPPVETI